jgi:hypothetical protein
MIPEQLQKDISSILGNQDYEVRLITQPDGVVLSLVDTKTSKYCPIMDTEEGHTCKAESFIGLLAWAHQVLSNLGEYLEKEKQ